jgi:hypothetical protein
MESHTIVQSLNEPTYLEMILTYKKLRFSLIEIGR